MLKNIIEWATKILVIVVLLLSGLGLISFSANQFSRAAELKSLEARIGAVSESSKARFDNAQSWIIDTRQEVGDLKYQVASLQNVKETTMYMGNSINNILQRLDKMDMELHNFNVKYKVGNVMVSIYEVTDISDDGSGMTGKRLAEFDDIDKAIRYLESIK